MCKHVCVYIYIKTCLVKDHEVIPFQMKTFKSSCYFSFDWVKIYKYVCTYL